MSLRDMVWADYPAVVEMFLQWPMDSRGPCTPDRTRGHMERWFQQFHPYVWEADGRVVGCINCNHDYSEITHTAVLPEHQGQGHFSAMYRALAEIVIAMGIESMEFDALDQASWIADKFHRQETHQGETGPIHRAQVRATDFE